MQRLKRYAPGLRRMLTEEPGDDIWPARSTSGARSASNYDHEAAEKPGGPTASGSGGTSAAARRPRTARCSSTIRPPSCGSGTGRRGSGRSSARWSGESNYWTSERGVPGQAAEPLRGPDGLRQRLLDAARRTKRHWGNGDGRFIYPPLAAAVPGLSGPRPVIEPPVSSIRWEMLREGVEDYEYLYSAARPAGQAAASSCPRNSWRRTRRCWKCRRRSPRT